MIAYLRTSLSNLRVFDCPFEKIPKNSRSLLKVYERPFRNGRTLFTVFDRLFEKISTLSPFGKYPCQAKFNFSEDRQTPCYLSFHHLFKFWTEKKNQAFRPCNFSRFLPRASPGSQDMPENHATSALRILPSLFGWSKKLKQVAKT